MVNKVVLVIFDGLGDRPINELNNLTPLEAAKTPNLDNCAQEGECGVMYTLGRGIVPGSDTAHLAILGYDPEKYYHGRGPLEAAGIGLKLQPGDIAFRANWGTVNDDLIAIDRRAGRIEDGTPFVNSLNGMEIDGVKFILEPSIGYRAVLVMRGKGLSYAISDVDPHSTNKKIKPCTPLDESTDAKFTSNVLNKFLEKAHEILNKHDENKARTSIGKPPANYLLVRGAGKHIDLPPFDTQFGLKACCIAGGGLYKGVASYLGMDIIDIPGATAKANTNITGKFEKAVELVGDYGFVFVHVKQSDNFGHDGNYLGKKEFIEKIDVAFKIFQKLDKETLLIVTADHSTPCELKSHSADYVPIIFKGSGVRSDQVNTFGERACSNGGLGILLGKDVMGQVMNLLGKLEIYGA